MSAIDMATLGILSLAVLLQVLAGLIVFLYTDFNPSRPSRDDPSETDNFQEVPRGESILIDTNSDSDVREVGILGTIRTQMKPFLRSNFREAQPRHGLPVVARAVRAMVHTFCPYQAHGG